MPHLTRDFPTFIQNLEGLDPNTRRIFESLIRQIELFRGSTIENFNAQELEFIAQASRPTPLAGQALFWQDTDALSGQPTHYLVYTDPNSVTVTFRSVETVP